MKEGQVNYENNKLGQWIYKISGQEDVHTIVEIGTWNGLGTTRCVIDGLNAVDKKEYKFISLECYQDMHKEAVKNNQENLCDNIHLLCAKVIDENQIDEWFDVSTLSNEQQGWLEQDKQWMSLVPNTIDSIPEKIDFLILDGGEFSTYPEWQALKSRAKYVALDDTTQLKCKKIREEVLADDSFEILEDDLAGSRYGFLIFKKK